MANDIENRKYTIVSSAAGKEIAKPMCGVIYSTVTKCGGTLAAYTIVLTGNLPADSDLSMC